MGLIIGSGGLHIGTSGGGGTPVEYLETSVEYTRRKSGGSDAIASGKAKITKMKGKTLVWNQLVQNGDFSNGTTNWSASSELNATIENGSYKVTARDSQQWDVITQTSSVAFAVGHKYYLGVGGKSDGKNAIHFFLQNDSGSWTNGIYPYFNLKASWSRFSIIVTLSSAATNYGIKMLLRGQSQSTSPTEAEDIYLDNIVLFDLTQMFGAGNEPSTVAEFEALYPLPYYAYNEGTLISNAATGIETVGFNQWDEEWEVGSISGTDGTNVEGTTTIRAKNYITVFPGTTYYFKVSATGSETIAFRGYDANKNFVSTSLSIISNSTFTIPNGIRYVRFVMLAWYGTTYNNDICINLSDASLNGTYKPYWKNDLQLNLPTLTGKLNGEGSSVVVFPDGMRSVGTAFDELVVDSDGVARKAIKRVGSVVVDGVNNKVGEYSADELADRFNGYFSNDVTVFYPQTPYVSDKFEFTGLGSKRIPYTFCNTNTAGLNRMFFFFPHDMLQSNAEANTWFASHPTTVYYVMATPEEYILDTPLPAKYKVAPGGTEERLPADTASSVIAPISYDVKYPKPKE